MTVLSPFVYWAQSEESIFMKVDLKNSTNTDVNFKQRRLEFKAKGLGARGINDYIFSLDLHSNINAEESSYKVLDNSINLQICKESKAWWPRLMSQPQKPAWLKIDFDKWQSEEDFDDEAYDKLRDIREDYQQLYNKLQKEELGYNKEEFKKVYLGLYNLFMFISYLYILVVLGIRFIKKGDKSYSNAYEAVGAVMVFLTTVQFLEVVHCLLGYTGGSLFATFLQTSGRMAIVKLIIDSESNMQTCPYVLYLFVFWSLIEIIRYPFYITQVYKREIFLLTWLRYTAWIPLYPLGFLAEVLILYKSIPYFETSGKYSVSLPNSLNFSFSFTGFIRICLLLFCFPLMYFLMSHMYRARKKKFGPKKIKKIK